ncbi:MAG: hypothetical protein ABIH64_01850, partial [Nanoarchaeota archaeon]
YMAYQCPKCKKTDQVEPFNFKHMREGYTAYSSTGDIIHTESMEEDEQELNFICKRCLIHGNMKEFKEV